MKKFKKILSAVSAAVLCALPMMNGVAVNAASNEEYKNTFVIYHDVQNSKVAYFDFTIVYDSCLKAEPSMKTDLCGTNSFNSIHYDISRQIKTTYSGKAFGTTGTAATTKFLGALSVSIDDIYDLISYDKVTVKNANGGSMAKTALSYEIYLLGDANQDKCVDIADATAILQSMVNPDEYGLSDEGKRAADINLDGVVDKADALLIQQYEAGVIKHF